MRAVRAITKAQAVKERCFWKGWRGPGHYTSFDLGGHGVCFKGSFAFLRGGKYKKEEACKIWKLLQ